MDTNESNTVADHVPYPYIRLGRDECGRVETLDETVFADAAAAAEFLAAATGRPWFEHCGRAYIESCGREDDASLTKSCRSGWCSDDV